MANLIGEGFNDYVRRQIIHRQKIYGSGVSEGRTEKEITYLNSRTAWIKVASSVSLESSEKEKDDKETMAKLRRKNLGLVGEISLKKDLAKKFVLFNGVSSLNKDSGSILKQRSGYLDSNTDKQSTHNFSYGMGGLEFGLQPMPGIISMNVEALNMGSLKKTILKIKAYNKEQLAILDVLYLRLGYTLLVEFGNNLYLDKNGDVQNMGTTLIEDKFFSEELVGKSYRGLLPEIEKKRLEYCGNYDAFFGRITNFSWDFNPDGSYDIEIQLYSLGDVIESLKLNQVNTKGLLEKFKNSNKDQKKHMASRFKKDYKDEDILEFLEQQERERNKIYEYLKEIQTFDSYKDSEKFIKELDKNIVTNQQQAAAVVELSTTYQNNDTTGQQFEAVVSNQTQTAANEAFKKAKGDLIAYDGTEYFRVFKLSEDGNPANASIFYHKSLGLDSGDLSTLRERSISSSPGLTESEISGGSTLKYNNELKNLSDNYSDFKKVDYTETFKGTTFTVQIYAFTNDFITSGNYVGEQIKFKDVDPFKNQAVDENIKEKESLGFISIEFYTNGEKYDITFFENSTFENFNPQLGIQTQGSEARNRVPFPSDFDDKILAENNSIIGAAQEKINDSLDPDFNLTKNKSKETIPVNSQVHVKITKFKQKSKNERIGHVINHKVGWNLTKLYKTRSKTSDHIKIKKYQPIDNSYFIRFGTFLEFIKENILYKVNNGGSKKSNSSIFQLDTDIDSNIMYTLPNHVSLDPTQAIVNVNIKSIGSNIKTFTGLEEFQNTKPFYGKIMNIYLSHDFIFEQLSANVDEKNNLILFNFLDSICTRLNVIFGGINNLHPSIDETTNCIKIYDDTPIPNLGKISDYLVNKNPTKYKFYEDVTNFQWNCNTLPNQSLDYTLNLYGYNGTKTESNFVTDVKIKTKVTKDIATMLSIGATANGYVVGEEATAFSKWNYGIKDRYYEEIVDAEYDEKIESEIAETLKKENEEIQRTYAYMIFYNFEYSQRRYYSGAYEAITNPEEMKKSQESGKYPPVEATTVIKYGGGVILPQQIEENIASGTSFYQYLIASASAVSNNTRPIANTEGFLPITLDISLDGLSGPKIYQKLQVDTDFLPNNYPEAMDFIIRGVSHDLQNNKWSTKLSTLATSQVSNEPVYLPSFNYDIKVISKIPGGGSLKEANPYKGSTSVRNFKSNSYPIIVRSEAHIEEWQKQYGNTLSKKGKPFTNFLIREGLGNPNSFAEKFTQLLETEFRSKGKNGTRLVIKGDSSLGNTEKVSSGKIENQLGSGADISEDLYYALLEFWKILGRDEYKKYYPIIIVGGNDEYHHGPTIAGSGAYGESGAFVQPYNTTHTRGLAIDLRQRNIGSGPNGMQRNKAVQGALKEAGFTGIIWHNPPHIHANISSIESDNNSGFKVTPQTSTSSTPVPQSSTYRKPIIDPSKINSYKLENFEIDPTTGNRINF